MSREGKEAMKLGERTGDIIANTFFGALIIIALFTLLRSLSDNSNNDNGDNNNDNGDASAVQRKIEEHLGAMRPPERTEITEHSMSL